MKLAILSAVLNNFDTPVDPVEQELPKGIDLIEFHRWTDSDFPPITGLTPRFQYRIPKLFGWQMKPDYDYYIWLDGTFSFTRPDSVKWFMKQLGNADIALFKHPWRNTIGEEVAHIQEHLDDGKVYITSRYKNGLHKEQFEDILLDKDYVDDHLFTSTAFIYKDSEEVRNAMRNWWLHQSRYFTCDQVVLPYVVKDLVVKTIPDNQYKCKYLTMVSEHK